jgi:hypothetical protein
VSLNDRVWYRAELRDLNSDATATDGESDDSEEDELEIVDAAEAVKRLQFPLYLPERVPRNSEMEIQVDTSGNWASLSLVRSDFQWRVLIRERPAEDLVEEDLDQWERLEGIEDDGWIWDQSNDAAEPFHRWLVVRTKRTRCSLYSTLPRHLLAEVATSLRPLV